MTALLVVLGAAGLAALGAGPLRHLLPRGDVSPLPIGSAVLAAPASATELVPDQEQADDAGAQSAEDKKALAMLPDGCKLEHDICECCEAGRNCGPGTCSDAIGREEVFHLRLGWAKADGKSLLYTNPTVAVCLRFLKPDAEQVCTPVEQTRDYAVPETYLEIKGSDFERFALVTDVMDPSSSGLLARTTKEHKNLFRNVLCDGLRLDLAAGYEVLLFLDDPSVKPTRCAPK
jgi:hypothetical protein